MSELSLIEAQLQDISRQWLSLPLETKEQQAAAAQFYSERVFPLVQQVFVAKEAPKVKTPIYGLILPLGTSPEPLILSISAIQPQKVLFLCTDETEPLLDQIVASTGLSPRQWDKRIVDPANPLHIYREIREAWVRWGCRRDIAVDFTGGTKSMSGGAAMAGALIGAQLVYIATRPGRYLRDPYRRPEPGSEYLEFVPNPYAVFGDLDEREAASRFQRYDFAGAQIILQRLAERTAQPRQYEALAHLAAAYKSWEDLNFEDACKHLARVIDLVSIIREQDLSGKASVLAHHSDLLRSQLADLQGLSRMIPSKPGTSALPLLQDLASVKVLAFTIHGAARRQEERGNYDTAALLLYRLAELMAQRRLAAYGLDTAEPDYGCLKGFDLTAVLARVNEIRTQLKHEPSSQLPQPISLVNSYVLLEALKDQFGLAPAGIHWQRFLREIRGRNYSIFAHGFIFVSQTQYKRFSEMIDSLLVTFCSVEGIDFRTAQEACAFIDPWSTREQSAL